MKFPSHSFCCIMADKKTKMCSLLFRNAAMGQSPGMPLNAEMSEKRNYKCILTGRETDCPINAGSLKLPHKKESSKSKSSDKFDDSLLDEPTPSKSTPSTVDSCLQDLF